MYVQSADFIIDFVLLRLMLIMVLFGICVQLLTESFVPVRIYTVLSSNGVCAHSNARKHVCAQCMRHGDVAQLGERCLRKAEAEGSTPFISTRTRSVELYSFSSFLPYSTSGNANIIMRKNSSIALSVNKCELPCLTGVTGCDRYTKKNSHVTKK